MAVRMAPSRVGKQHSEDSLVGKPGFSEIKTFFECIVSEQMSVGIITL